VKTVHSYWFDVHLFSAVCTHNFQLCAHFVHS
jgi:hypothetical protein